jgi:hypothetical protein
MTLPFSSLRANGYAKTVNTEYDIDPEGRDDRVWLWRENPARTRAGRRENTPDQLQTAGGHPGGGNLESLHLKADGRHIDAPKGQLPDQHPQRDKQRNPFFSGKESITVVFPDVAVGDTTYMRFRLRDTEAIFPGEASIVDGFSAFSAIEEGKRAKKPEARAGSPSSGSVARPRRKRRRHPPMALQEPGATRLE